MRPETAVLSGSMRFYPLMLRVAEQETAAGHIVLMPFVTVHDDQQDGEHKAMLDRLHRSKITMSDRVIVVSDETGYYGESTSREIRYAGELGLPVEHRCVSVAPDRDALTDALREAFNTAYERSDNPRVDRMHRHDQHQYAGACHVCRGDVDVLVPHIADRLISAGLVRTPVTAEQIENAARELHRRDLGDVNAWLHEPEHRRDLWRSKARTAAKALGLPVAEGGDRG